MMAIFHILPFNRLIQKKMSGLINSENNHQLWCVVAEGNTEQQHDNYQGLVFVRQAALCCECSVVTVKDNMKGTHSKAERMETEWMEKVPVDRPEP